MKASEIRETYLRFFSERGHERVPSAPVVPQDDPTLYFTNAGMNQFKDVFLGLGQRSYRRAVDTQKCIRVSGKHNDLEEVGVSPRHHTFFEMLGNWSFGDYFKAEAITWAWELVTEHWGLDKSRLWVTVFEGSEADRLEPDEETADLWQACTDLPAERIVPLPAKENFWEMGETGPCGPCSEMHYYHGDPGLQTAAGLRRGDDEFEEFWNLVFMQYHRDERGDLHALPARHVDTGLGFERMCSILQGTETNYETDVFQPLIGHLVDLTGVAYGGTNLVPMRVIVDHIRALSSSIADGALPANEGRGYVLRRILRRAARYGRQLDQHDPFVYRLVDTVAETLGNVFPELVQQRDHVALVIRSEEESFGRTLDRGLDIFARFSERGEISGAEAFQLYDTYGFPLDLTRLLARERGIPIVEPETFEQELEQQRVRARRATRGRFRAVEGVDDALEGSHSEFVGYTSLQCEAEIRHVEVEDDGQVRLFLNRTPFYAESGGQTGDQGEIRGPGFVVHIHDTVKGRGGIVHVGRAAVGEPQAVSGEVVAAVDAATRQGAARNHTATHLLHEALRRTLGEHVAQMGSLVSPQRLRFDFSHFNAVSPEQLVEIETQVNERIRANLAVQTTETTLADAKAQGARALFGEKYEDRVRVVRIDEYSLELCGGTHVRRTGEIGAFSILNESGIAAGTRRIEALTGVAAEQHARQQRQLLADLSARLNTSPEELETKVEGLQQRSRDLERKLAEQERQLATQAGEQLTQGACVVQGMKVVATRVDVADVGALRTAADALREQLGSGVGVLGTVLKDRVSFIAVVTEDLIKTRGLKAGDVVREVAQIAGGSGGGKPHLAQAGGRDVDKLDMALAAVQRIVTSLL